MRIRVRGPAGQAVISIADSATVGELLSQISAKTSIPSFDVMIGYPPKPLNFEQFDHGVKLTDTGLNLDGEQMIISPRDLQSKLQDPLKGTEPPPEAASRLPPTGPAPAYELPAKPLSLTRKENTVEAEPPEVPFPTRHGTLVLRVMPDDNSCLFRALGTAIVGNMLDAMTELRSLVAQVIQAQPDRFSEAVLEKPPDDYCRWIQREDSWGGDVELSIISEHFDFEVCCINVEDLKVHRINQQGSRRCILVYSGIHYDTIALSPSEPPYTYADLPPELDMKVFEPYDEEVVEKSVELCKILQGRHYYTNPNRMGIKCNVCGWQGAGEKAAVEHATTTNHYDFGESG